MVRGGVAGLSDSRIENLGRLRAAGMAMPLTLIRSPMLSQVDAVVRHCDVSLNTEPIILAALSDAADDQKRSEEHTSELQSLMRISYAVFCLQKKNNKTEK